MAVSVYPTGTTIYYPEKCWNGFTVFQTDLNGGKNSSVVLIDMNGTPVNVWKHLDGMPNKMLPGGYVMGSTGVRNPKYGFQDMIDLVQVDWDGNITWKFNQYELIRDPSEKPVWMARQHHDYQREGNPVGYYVPGSDPLVDRGNTLILCHKNLTNPKICDKHLLDDSIIEVTWEGEIIWEWKCNEHFDEIGFSEEAKNALARNPGMFTASGTMWDWMHLNSLSTLGPNRWFDQGDVRFHPDNIIWSSRQSNTIAIIDKKSGRIVWKVGPEYMNNPSLRGIGQIIGPHHAHMIPRGLPGEGNILVYDNGGWAGYGAPNPGAVTGLNNALRDYSRVLEFDPITLSVVWKYTPIEAGYLIPMNAYMFYSGFVSSAQRLPNGNTLITEGAGGRLLEVTREHQLVWEYVSPYFRKRDNMNLIYRAYRVPYEWVPQVKKPREKMIKRIDNSKFRVPGSPLGKEIRSIVIKKRGRTATFEGQYCINPIVQKDAES
ncbi:MAG: aryl-sulfate sulfotransferase [Dehalococcoidales bacterium]|nr:aryl-sulfate sulfotransferase [Dehalococcoidales bacterium]